MKKATFLLTLFIVTQYFTTYGQLVGGNAFLKGHWLEIGMCPNGAFGVCSAAPVGYHPHPGTTGDTQLAEVYDFGHDGWTTGTPNYMGDYTYPGVSLEGWELQCNGGRSQAFQNCWGTYVHDRGTLTGSITSYLGGSGFAAAKWTGTAAGGQLEINMETRVDTNASWVVVTTKMKNTGTTSVNDIYYLRTCDPDIDVTWPGGSYLTENWVTYQDDSLHRVLVSSRAIGPTHAYFGLGTCDARAKAFSYSTTRIPITTDLATIYSGSYPVGVHTYTDMSLGLIFNLGTIAPGGSTIFSYTYIFNDSASLDSAALIAGEPSIADSFVVQTTNYCSRSNYTICTKNYNPGMTIKSYFGDGSYNVAPILPRITGGYAYVDHSYAYAGTYSIKHILYQGSLAVDSFLYAWNYMPCNIFPIKFFNDDNLDCNKDNSEHYLYNPSLTEVDSNGVPIDTISCTSGFYYTAYGRPGDVYQFKILSLPTGYFPSCPSSGIITDTFQSSTYLGRSKSFGLSCIVGSDHDFHVNTSFRAGSHIFLGHILIGNSFCLPALATTSMTLSTKYTFSNSNLPTTSSSGGNVIWDIGSISSNDRAPVQINLRADALLMTYMPGDTVNSTYIADPISGDWNRADNINERVDTVKAGFDPNYIDVMPAGIISAGTELNYTIGFENTGNDTAFNISILDTLSDNIDFSTFKMVASSHEMYVSKLRVGGRNILKFDFPHINLLDSSHHNECTGLLFFNIKAKIGLPPGTTIYNRAGIYFDYNPVVITNTVEDIIGATSTLAVHNTETPPASIYPNPGTNSITIATTPAAYSAYTLHNAMGQEIIANTINTPTTNIDVKGLPAGVYTITIKGAAGAKVEKWVKW